MLADRKADLRARYQRFEILLCLGMHWNMHDAQESTAIQNVSWVKISEIFARFCALGEITETELQILTFGEGGAEFRKRIFEKSILLHEHVTQIPCNPNRSLFYVVLKQRHVGKHNVDASVKRIDGVRFFTEFNTVLTPYGKVGVQKLDSISEQYRTMRQGFLSLMHVALKVGDRRSVTVSM